MAALTTDFNSVSIGRNQVYSAGYSLDLNPIVITPQEGDVPVQETDPWRLRLIYGSNDYFIDPIKSIDGESLLLSYVFSPEETSDFGKHGTVRVIVEYDGSDSDPRPKMRFDLIRGTETGPVRPQTP